MAETTAVRKQELDAERQAVKARVARLRRRLDDDSKAVKDEAARLTGKDSPLSEHPGVLVAGSAALGFLVGVKSPGPPVSARAAAGAASKATGTATEALKFEAGLLIRDFISGAVGGDHSPDVRDRGMNGSAPTVS